MRTTWFRAVALSAALSCAAGCIPSGPDAATPGSSSLPSTDAAKTVPKNQAEPGSPVTKSAPELLQEWNALAESGEKHLGEVRPVEIGLALKASGAENLAPLLDVLGDPQSKPGAKALAMVSLREVVQPEMVERLKSMCKPDQDGTMRACAVDLISHAPGPDTAEFLKTLLNDSEKRVKIAALIGLVRRGDADARATMVEFLKQPENTPQQKAAMILAVTDRPTAADTPVMCDAIADETLDNATRASVAVALGRVGDASAIEALTRCSGDTAPDALRGVAKDALAAIEGRTKETPK